MGSRHARTATTRGRRGGRREARRPYDRFAFHDVDSLPSIELAAALWYGGDADVVHVAAPWCFPRYAGIAELFGGVTSYARAAYEACNGFPNGFWGWGGEDDAMYDRAAAAAVRAARVAPRGHFVLLEHAPATSASRNERSARGMLADRAGGWRATAFACAATS